MQKDEDESESRVWLDRTMTCGLAMSRSLGDLQFKRIGVTADPALTEHAIGPRDQFLIGASDGVSECVDGCSCAHVLIAVRAEDLTFLVSPHVCNSDLYHGVI